MRDANNSGAQDSILVIRLGAMGDIIHALPAAASLKQSFPDKKVFWVTKPRWEPLFENNPAIDEIVLFNRRSIAEVCGCYRRLRRIAPALAFDFQGLVQSALIGRIARPATFWGFDASLARESLAATFYTHRTAPPGPHRVLRNLQLVEAAGALNISDRAWIPAGRPDGNLPDAPFVLAAPFAGWRAKQWPLAYYSRLGALLAQQDVKLVMNIAPAHAAQLRDLEHVCIHESGIPGLIDATRRSAAVVGVDSGPVHLAAALEKAGVAIYGPTDPAINGPYGGTITVLRSPLAETSYARGRQIDPSMRAISPDQVCAALMRAIGSRVEG